jgi:ribosomal protein S18 acetylase RimI-like enzyme
MRSADPVASAEVEIRPARPGDARAFLDLWTEAVAEGFVRGEVVRLSLADVRRRFRRSWTDDEAELVAIEGGRLVGHLMLSRERHPVTRHVATLAIAVAPDRRRRGVGSALMDAGIAWARGRGVDKLLLSVYPHNEAALALYRRFGFVQEGRLARHSRTSYGELDEILMAAWIGPSGSDEPRDGEMGAE